MSMSRVKRFEPYWINAAPPMIRKSARISSLINSEAAVIPSIKRRCHGTLLPDMIRLTDSDMVGIGVCMIKA